MANLLLNIIYQLEPLFKIDKEWIANNPNLLLNEETPINKNVLVKYRRNNF